MIKRLPYRIRFQPRKAYGVNLVSGFPEELDGSCNPNTREIKLRAGMSDRQTVSALLHETIHLISFERSLDLTENQVLGLEHGIAKILELNPEFGKLLIEVFCARRRGSKG